jgi:predicted transcriptional regulator
MSTITLRVPDDMDRALQRQSTALGISKSDLAREALKRYLRVTEFRALRTKLVARAQASGINTDDDITAIAGECALLISVDRDLLDLQSVQDVPIIRPGEFWRRTAERD